MVGNLAVRRQQIGVIAAAGLAGWCFTPVFGGRALAMPLLVVCLACCAVVESCRRWPVLVPWRPLALVLGGVLGIVETLLLPTTVVGLPTPATIRALGSGLWSWRRTLESTWPAQPEPELMLFVPLLVLVACVLGVELLDRVGALGAMLPSLAVAGVSQTYDALEGSAAYVLVLCYAATAALVLLPAAARSATKRRPKRRDLAPLVAAMSLASAAAVGGLVTIGVDPMGRPPYTLQRVQSTDLPSNRPTSPLAEVAGRLLDPEAVVFRFRTDAAVDRWRLVALDDFDGTNWTTARPFLRFGAELAPGAALRSPMLTARADVEVRNLSAPWLPSQPLPRSVDASREVFVEPVGGTLYAKDRPRTYSLAWYTQRVTAHQLLHSAVDRDVRVSDLGNVPRDVAALASRAVGGRRATFQTALALERYLATHYQLVNGPDADAEDSSAGRQTVPTGHGWPQLRRFLFGEKRGTSEQFAAAYVVLARLNGIPARLVVGFRAPEDSDRDGWTTVRNHDVLVWPEVAVDGIGWWPLDPAGLASPGRQVGGGQDEVTERARAELPPPGELDDPPAPREAGEPGQGRSVPASKLTLWHWAWLLALPPVGWLVGVPVLRSLRTLRRRRQHGSAAVVGAWAEVRDRLRAHGVRVTAGTTVRDLARAAGQIADDQTVRGLEQVAWAVDRALWSPVAVDQRVVDDAWAGVRQVNRGLRRRPWAARVRATLDVRSLLSA